MCAARRLPLIFIALVLAAPAGADARSSIRVGLADQNPAVFDDPAFKRANIERTRYFVAEDVMTDDTERAKARAFVQAAKANDIAVLLHISTADLRDKQGKLVSEADYRSHIQRTVAYFRDLGVRDFGAWNEANHKSQETWNHPEHAASYFQSMYGAVKQGQGKPDPCDSCGVVGLDLLDQGGVDDYIRDVYKQLSSTWRKRLTIVGIHNYSDVNRERSSGTSTIIKTVHKYGKPKFWFTETGALASFGGSFPYSESRQKDRIRNMFSLASQYRESGVDRVYSYNWYGIENGTGCGDDCRFDAGLVDPDGTPRPVYDAWRDKLSSYSR